MSGNFPYTFPQPQCTSGYCCCCRYWAYWFYYKRDSFYASFNIPQHGVLTQPTSLKVKLFRWLPLLSLLAFTGIVFALARPQSALSEKEISTQGIDIVLSLDISGSLCWLRDFQPDRLEAAKKVAMQFIRERPNDRIGLVVFSGESFTQSPSPSTIRSYSIYSKILKAVWWKMVRRSGWDSPPQ